MNIGDKLDPQAIGHNAIDIKGLLLEHGYAMPQGSIAKLPLLPGEVQAAIAQLEVLREAYATLDESKTFSCRFCGTLNSASWKREVATGTEFLCCGECHTVVEVR